MKTALYQIDQIRKLESLVFSKNYDTEIGLMKKAGSAAFKYLTQCWPAAQSILIVCGKGNNGGDGFVVAKLAKQAGMRVRLVSILSESDYQGTAQEALQSCLSSGVVIKLYSGSLDYSADIVVDALLGIGIKGVVSDLYRKVIDQINTMNCPVLAIDTPSGLDVDTGKVMGVAVKADATMTFIGLKQGLFTYKAPTYCGSIACDSLQLPEKLFSAVSSSAELLQWEVISSALPRRERDAHKGSYGHVLVIGGDYGMSGAVRMSAEAALRVGAGLVSVATRGEHVPVVSTQRPEIMCHSVVTQEDLYPLLERASVIVLGPGLGRRQWGKMLFETVMSYDSDKILDADALNLLSQHHAQSDRWILTPHSGEAGRLLGINSHQVQENRFLAVKSLQEKYLGIAVLKGAGTVIQMADMPVKVCPAGNPGMASGGMGDVLSGVIGGLVAQGFTLPLAAELGVTVHAIAADNAAEDQGERGLLASDLMPYLHQLINPNSNKSL